MSLKSYRTRATWYQNKMKPNNGMNPIVSLTGHSGLCPWALGCMSLGPQEVSYREVGTSNLKKEVTRDPNNLYRFVNDLCSANSSS
jgi:hypothetical protein